jgi:hypothetical protein
VALRVRLELRGVQYREPDLERRPLVRARIVRHQLERDVEAAEAQDLHQGLTYAGIILNYEYGGRRGQQCAEQVDPPTDVQLPEHGAQMRFHCLFADAEPCGGLVVGQPLDHGSNDLLLPGG